MVSSVGVVTNHLLASQSLGGRSETWLAHGKRGLRLGAAVLLNDLPLDTRLTWIVSPAAPVMPKLSSASAGNVDHRNSDPVS